jgi:hypothetical protein
VPSGSAGANRPRIRRKPWLFVVLRLLDPDLTLASSTAGARDWMDALPAASLFAAWGMLPAQVYPVAAVSRSRNAVMGAHALERAVDGRWVMIEAAPLDGDGDGQIAVTLRGAAPTETFDLLCRAYAFTRRERDVAAAVVAGLDTRAPPRGSSSLATPSRII